MRILDDDGLDLTEREVAWTITGLHMVAKMLLSVKRPEAGEVDKLSKDLDVYLHDRREVRKNAIHQAGAQGSLASEEPEGGRLSGGADVSDNSLGTDSPTETKPIVVLSPKPHDRGVGDAEAGSVEKDGSSV